MFVLLVTSKAASQTKPDLSGLQA